MSPLSTVMKDAVPPHATPTSPCAAHVTQPALVNTLGDIWQVKAVQDVGGAVHQAEDD